MKFRILFAFLINCAPLAFSAETKIDFWNTQRKGSNLFNEVETPERLRAAKDFGMEIVRLTFTKWKSHRPGAAHGEFLLGDLNHYSGLVEEDLAQLIQVLDEANKVGLKVVLTTL